MLTVSNVGFFYPYFTVKSCDQFYLLPPIFKGTRRQIPASDCRLTARVALVIQAMVAQAILGLRQVRMQASSILRLTLHSAYNLSRRSRLTSSLLALLYMAACTVGFAYFIDRHGRSQSHSWSGSLLFTTGHVRSPPSYQRLG